MPAPRKNLVNAPKVQAPQPRAMPQDTGARRLPGAMEVPIEQLLPDANQPRRDWSYQDGEARLNELAASVREFGILQPLLVREEGALPDGRQRYAIIAGGRRYAAATLAGLATLPCVVRGDDLGRVRFMQLVENLQRQDLAPLDEARAYQELIDLQKCSPRQLAVLLHVSDQQVRLRLRLLSDQVLADAVERRQIAANTARLIQQLPDEEQEPFRERVRQGERLQENDLAAVRARLLAEGAIHPRRTRPPKAADHGDNGQAQSDAAGITGSLAGERQPVRAGTVAERETDSGEGATPVQGEARSVETPAEGVRIDPARGHMVIDPLPHTHIGEERPVKTGWGQIPFDPLPQSGGVEGATVAALQALLSAAEPEVRRALGRAVRGADIQDLEPQVLADALLLAGAVLRAVAAADTGDRTWIRLLVETDNG